MLRKTAVLATAGAVLLSASVAAAQGAAPNANPANPTMPNAGAGATGAGANVGTANQQAGMAEFTGTVKEWNDQEKVLTMDTGDKFYIRAGDNAPLNTTDIKVGSRVKLTYVIDTNMQGEKVIRGIAPAT